MSVVAHLPSARGASAAGLAELESNAAQGGAVRTMQLQRLARSDVAELVVAELGVIEVDPMLLEFLEKRCVGNPGQVRGAQGSFFKIV